MNNKIHFPLILGWLLIPYGIGYYVSLNGINFGDLGIYTEVFRQWTLLLCLLLLLGCIWISQYQSSERTVIPVTGPSVWIGWLAGLLLPLGIVLGLFTYINPHARFTGNRFPYVTVGARLIKTELYKDLDIVPDIIIMGSSRAFTLSPEYIEKQTGYKAFNMSVDVARGGDYSAQLKVMQNHMPPQVLIVEFNQNSLPRNKADYFVVNQQPVSLIPYMPLDSKAPFMDMLLRDAFGLQALSDSIFIVTLPDARNRIGMWSFGRNGLGTRKPIDLEAYRNLMKSDIKDAVQSMHCRNDSNETSKHAFEDFLKSALKNNIGVVLYESPMNGAFYDAAYKSSPDRFQLCRRIIHNYLKSLTKKYPNVFFRDLSSDKQINDLRRDGFYDIIHLKPIASDMVVDQLLPDIESAMAWSREKQHRVSP